MGKVQQAAGGGLTRADKAKLVPGNIRQGVTLFEGTSRQINGTLQSPVSGNDLVVDAYQSPGTGAWGGVKTLNTHGRSNLLFGWVFSSGTRYTGYTLRITQNDTVLKEYTSGRTTESSDAGSFTVQIPDPNSDLKLQICNTGGYSTRTHYYTAIMYD